MYGGKRDIYHYSQAYDLFYRFIRGCADKRFCIFYTTTSLAPFPTL